MSILSQAVREILGGQNPIAVFQTAKSQVEAWGAQIKSKLPSDVQAFIDTEVSVVKQGASSAIVLADTLAGPFLGDAADAVNGAFVALVSPYLGPFTGLVTKAEADMVFKLRDHLKDQLDQEALSFLAQRAATPSLAQAANSQANVAAPDPLPS